MGALGPRGHLAPSGKGMRRVYKALLELGLVARDVTLIQWARGEAEWRRADADPLRWIGEACFLWLLRKRAVAAGKRRPSFDLRRRAHPRRPL